MKTFTLAALAASLLVAGCGKSDDASVSTPASSPKASASPTETPIAADSSVTEADLGVPFYPGSAPAEGSGKSSVGNNRVCDCKRTTKDAPEKVVDFYKDALKKAGFESIYGSVNAGVGNASGSKDGNRISVTMQVNKNPSGPDNLIWIANSSPKK